MAGLNAFAPSHINAYPSMLHRLALEAGAGRLRIAPLELSCGAEPLLPEARRAIEAAFAVPIINTYACSEVGVMARSLPGGGGGGPHDGMEQWPDRGAQQQAEAGQARNVRARRLSPAPAARAANRLSSRLISLLGLLESWWQPPSVPRAGGRLARPASIAEAGRLLPISQETRSELSLDSRSISPSS